MHTLISAGAVLCAAVIRAVSPFNEKARMWTQGRQGIFRRLESVFASNELPLWVHCASLGEYEQARPFIEKVKKESPDTKVLVTFFSPSGYEIRKNDSLPDYVFYLPADTLRNARRFVRTVKPCMAVFIKYEFWFNYMRALHEQTVPFYYICAVFRPQQYFFKPIGRWFRKQLRLASGFFVQNDLSAQLLRQAGIHQVTVCGDTRFDRVYAIASQNIRLDFVETFKQDHKLIVAGSTWGPDEQLLSALFSQLEGYKLVVAPHEISRKDEVMRTFAGFKTVAYTEMEHDNLADCEVLVVDTIGLLNKIYRYSTLSYIGGAFKTGLHNILEAAVFGVPLFFGPHYSHFNEAVMLVQLKGSFPVTSSEEMLAIVRRFDREPEFYGQTCTVCRQYVASNIGACDLIYQNLFSAQCLQKGIENNS